jgi:hypothetical protein
LRTNRDGYRNNEGQDGKSFEVLHNRESLL